ncbi:MAG: ABC transporter permease [Cyclobacteriaceae bacterium]|nr:MAG: ABC transporter permease [Cyclobacteriaceae bacterium]
MLADQKSYDQFHTNKERVYRILTDPGNRNPYATGPVPLALALRTDYPVIEESTQLVKGFGGDAFYNQNFAEVRGYFADPGFFKTFSFELTKGDPNTALELPNSMVITSEIARQLFKDEDPIGKTIDFSDRGIDIFTDEGNPPVDWGSYKITGVISRGDYKSHLEFDVLVSVSSLEHLYKENKIRDSSEDWQDYSRCYTYVLLEENASKDDLTVLLDQLAPSKQQANSTREKWSLIPQALTEITPGPMLGNDPAKALPKFVYYILFLLALVVLVSACINYTNLSIARAVTRLKEIGVRKVNGAKRKDLIFQFLSESLLVAILALILGTCFLYFVKSAFLNLWVNQYLRFDLSANVLVYLSFLFIALIVGLSAGIFPAMHLSGFSPARTLGSLQTLGLGRLSIRKVLTVTQFVVSLFFIITAIVVYNQFEYYMKYEYGFNASQVININLQSNDYQLVENALGDVSGVHSIAGSAYLPGTGRNDNTILKKVDSDDSIQAIDLQVDEKFLEVMEINLVAGRNLPDIDMGPSSYILVNQEAVDVLGFERPDDIIGEVFTSQGRDLEVVGVVEDFTVFLLFSKKATGPIVLRNEPEKFNFASLKIQADNRDALISLLEDKWKTVDPLHPLKYEFYQDKLANYNRGILDLVSVIGFFAFLAITIACLGLIGISIYTTERRTKEVGIRKVLGANGFGLTYLLSKEYLKLLAIAILIAAPISFYVNNLWLNFLVNKVNLGLGTIFIGSLLLFVLGLLAIAPQTLRISNSNPVNSLKHE